MEPTSEARAPDRSLHDWVGTTASLVTVATAAILIIAGAALLSYRVDQQDRRNDQQDKRLEGIEDRAERHAQDIRNRFDAVIQAQGTQGAKIEMIYDRVRERR